MARYIDVDNLNVSEYVVVWDCNCLKDGRQVVMAVDDLQYLPTADVQEIRHGKWEKIDNGEEKYVKCCVCGDEYSYLGFDEIDIDSVIKSWNYCVGCGAKMDA